MRGSSRTQAHLYHRGEHGEDPVIGKELADLAHRRQKVFGVTQHVYRGKNK